MAAFRIAEWWLLVYLFFDRNLTHLEQTWKVARDGTIWSFLLDGLALIGLYFAGELRHI